MGNRVFVTIKDPQKNQSFYMHWNGGLDTWLPLTKVLFDHDIKDISQAVKFVESLGLKIELENVGLDEVEENGHYFVDLAAKSFLKKQRTRGYEGDFVSALVYDFEKEFDNYLFKYQDSVREKIKKDYWEAILNKGNEVFGRMK